MLLDFSVKNYRSFFNTATLDMHASNFKENRSALLKENNVEVLPVAVIYGSNASGKSNFIRAFHEMRETVMSSLNYDKEMDFEFDPFYLSNESKNIPTEFEISISVKKREYRYGFSATQREIISEWLYEKKLSKGDTKEYLVFNRNEEFESGKQNFWKNIKFKKEDIRQRDLILTYLGRRDVEMVYDVYMWFLYCPMINFGPSVEESLKNSNAEFLNNCEDIKDKCVEFIHEFDENIINFIINKKETPKNVKYEIEALHKGNDGNEVLFPIDYESDGTNKLLVLLPVIFVSIAVGGILFVDELDAKLHPLIVRRLVQYYQDPNKNKHNAQLVFASHNLIVFNNEDLRRDQIYLVEKDNRGVSELYSLADLRDEAGKPIRADLDFYKNYLTGRFGAIPYLKN